MSFGVGSRKTAGGFRGRLKSGDDETRSSKRHRGYRGGIVYRGG